MKDLPESLQRFDNALRYTLLQRGSKKRSRNFDIAAYTIHTLLILRLFRLYFNFLFVDTRESSTFLMVMVLWSTCQTTICILCYHFLPREWFRKLMDQLIGDNANKQKYLATWGSRLFWFAFASAFVNTAVSYSYPFFADVNNVYYPYNGEMFFIMMELFIATPNTLAWFFPGLVTVLSLLVISRELEVLKQFIFDLRQLTLDRVIRINNQHIKLSESIVWVNRLLGSTTAMTTISNALITVILLTRKVLGLDQDPASWFPSLWWSSFSVIYSAVLFLMATRVHTASVRIGEGLSRLTHIGIHSKHTQELINAPKSSPNDDDDDIDDDMESSLLSDMDNPVDTGDEELPTVEQITLLILGVKSRVTGLRFFNTLEITTPLISSIGSLLITAFFILYNLVGSGRFVPP